MKNTSAPRKGRPLPVPIEEAERRLKAARLPLTGQRRAIYERLAGRSDHPSAESLYRTLGLRYPRLSLATVYKTLRTFQRLGLAQAVDSPSAKARYDALTAPHHHAFCAACGAIQDIFDDALDRLKMTLPAGFQPTSYSVQFRGFCAPCSRARTTKEK